MNKQLSLVKKTLDLIDILHSHQNSWADGEQVILAPSTYNQLQEAKKALVEITANINQHYYFYQIFLEDDSILLYASCEYSEFEKHLLDVFESGDHDFDLSKNSVIDIGIVKANSVDAALNKVRANRVKKSYTPLSNADFYANLKELGDY